MPKPVKIVPKERPKRVPYSDIAFPRWVRTTDCRQISSSFLIHTRHGAVKMIETVEI